MSDFLFAEKIFIKDKRTNLYDFVTCCICICSCDNRDVHAILITSKERRELMTNEEKILELLIVMQRDISGLKRRCGGV